LSYRGKERHIVALASRGPSYQR